MGKAALIAVIAASLAGMSMYMSNLGARYDQTHAETYQQELMIAREIARTGYAIAVGIAREHGDNLIAAVQAVNGAEGALTGEQQGGHYVARAVHYDGHTLAISATGHYGGAEATVGDQLRVRVLEVRRRGVLSAQFLQSMAGFCSAVYLQQHLPGVAASEQPAPQILFEPNNRRDGLGATFSDTLEVGTQLNFFIGVNRNCGRRPSGIPTDPAAYAQWLAGFRRQHVFNAANYNHIHYALEVPADLDNIRESPWAMVEQHPNDDQRWRISWEDQHIGSWLSGTTIHSSLELTKQLGYDGIGWVDRVTDGWCTPVPACRSQPDGYRDLRDYGNRPDFSDQVIEIRMRPL
ncbi:hypothetical protein BH23BAC4_BH23BAC4_10310 [soil metagenome]